MSLPRGPPTPERKSRDLKDMLNKSSDIDRSILSVSKPQEPYTFNYLQLPMSETLSNDSSDTRIDHPILSVSKPYEPIKPTFHSPVDSSNHVTREAPLSAFSSKTTCEFLIPLSTVISNVERYTSSLMEILKAHNLNEESIELQKNILYENMMNESSEIIVSSVSSATHKENKSRWIRKQ
jgi:hypothetical protein